MVGGEEVGAVTARGQQQHLPSTGMPVQPGRDVVDFGADVDPTAVGGVVRGHLVPCVGRETGLGRGGHREAPTVALERGVVLAGGRFGLWGFSAPNEFWHFFRDGHRSLWLKRGTESRKYKEKVCGW